MRYLLFTIALSLLLNVTKAQCPDGAGASVVFYMPWHIDQTNGGVIVDTLNSFNVFNFQPFTKVYFYNNNNTLIDSVYTSVDGSGSVGLSPSVNDSLWTDFSSGFQSLGVATNGICSKNVSGFALLPIKISQFSVAASNNNFIINWQTEMDEPGTKYIIQQSDNGASFTDMTTVVSTSTNMGRYSYTGLLFFNKTKYFRIKVVNKDQKFFYSETKTLNANISNDIVVSVMGSNRLSVIVPEDFVKGHYSIYNEAGSLLSHGIIFSKSFILSPNSGKGIYYIRIADEKGKRITKPFIISE